MIAQTMKNEKQTKFQHNLCATHRRSSTQMQSLIFPKARNSWFDETNDS